MSSKKYITFDEIIKLAEQKEWNTDIENEGFWSDSQPNMYWMYTTKSSLKCEKCNNQCTKTCNYKGKILQACDDCFLKFKE